MKWFKHMTASKTDEKIAQLLDIAGLEGYGFYWTIIELIAAQVNGDDTVAEVTYSLPTLSRMTYSHHHKVSNLLGKLQVTGLMTVSKSELLGVVNYTISCPNILKYRDEWTSRKPKTRESLGSHSGETPDVEQKKNKIQKKMKMKEENPSSSSSKEFVFIPENDSSSTAPVSPFAKTTNDIPEDFLNLSGALGKPQVSQQEMIIWQELKSLNPPCLIQDVESARLKKSKNNLFYLKNVVCECRDERIREEHNPNRPKTNKELLDEFAEMAKR